MQTDDSGNLAVLGTTAALLSVTIDGISSVGVEYSGPVNEMFPSFNSIEEIRVSESNNNAEFSGVADITTVSKAGTIHYHGGLFENHENTVFNANNPFALSKPKIIMNDFGGTLGGPLRIPRLSNGPEPRPSSSPATKACACRAKRPSCSAFPPRTCATAISPATLLSRESPPSACPTSPSPNRLHSRSPPASLAIRRTSRFRLSPPTCSPTSCPRPTSATASSYANNYQINFPSPISANQGDVRLDQHHLLASRLVFARFSYKNRQVTHRALGRLHLHLLR